MNRLAMVSCGAVMCCLPVPSIAADPAADAADESLRIYAFLGEVVDSFASSARKSGDDGTAVGVTGGIEFHYVIVPRAMTLYAEFIHSKRQADVSAESALTGGGLTAAALETVIESSNTLEWLGGLKLSRKSGDREIFLKIEGGFIRFADGADDVIDNHFLGLGVEHTTGKFRGSHAQFGVGRTDLFPVRGGTDHWWDYLDRWKAGAVAEYRPADDSRFGYFLETWLDTDVGREADDIQIYFGVFANLAEILDP